jgi:hypothetical protein
MYGDGIARLREVRGWRPGAGVAARDGDMELGGIPSGHKNRECGQMNHVLFCFHFQYLSKSAFYMTNITRNHRIHSYPFLFCHRCATFGSPRNRNAISFLQGCLYIGCGMNRLDFRRRSRQPHIHFCWTAITPGIIRNCLHASRFYDDLPLCILFHQLNITLDHRDTAKQFILMLRNQLRTVGNHNT